MGSGYQFAFAKAMADLQAMDPVAVSANAVAEYSALSGQYRVLFFDKPFIADIKTEEVFDQSTGSRSGLGTGMLILHYLAFAQDNQPAGKWITLKEVPNGGMLFYPAFKKMVLDALVTTFQHDIAAFDLAAASLNGRKLKMGDSAATFAAFPKIPLAAIMWGADEEFGGSANFLYDSSIEYFLPVETLIGLGYYVGHKLVHALTPASGQQPDAMWEAGIE